MGCRVLAAHSERIGAHCAASAAGAQASIRRALEGLRAMRARPGADGAVLDAIERALIASGLYMQDHDVIRQYQAVVSAALAGIAGRLEELGGTLPEDALALRGGAAEAFLDELWHRYVSDDQREVHRDLVGPGPGGDLPRLPRTELF